MRINDRQGEARRGSATLDKLFSRLGNGSEVFDAVGAEDVVFACLEASTHQRHAASFAVEAVVVPLTLLEGDVLAASEA